MSQVAGKLTTKPAPEDPNELLARREEQKREMLEQEKQRELKKQRNEQAKARHKVDMEREDRAPEIAAIEEEKKAEVRRRGLMSNPELLTELQLMEYKLNTSTFYSCKLCGIQAMTLADAESHIFEEEHKKLRSERLQGSTAHISREEEEKVDFGHHLVLTLKEGAEVWPRPWGWLIGDPDCVPLPSRDSYQQAVEALGQTELGRKCSKRFSSFVEVIKEGTREGYRDFQATLNRPCSAEAKKEDIWVDLKLLECCLRMRFDLYLVPLLKAIGLTFSPTQPNLFVGLEGVSDYRIVVFAEKEVDGVFQHPWAVCLVTKVVEVDSLEKLAGLAVAKALRDRGKEGLKQLECSAIQREIVRGFLDKEEKVKDCEIQMQGELNESNCKTEEEEDTSEKLEKGSDDMKSDGEKSIGRKPDSRETKVEESKIPDGKDVISVKTTCKEAKGQETGKELISVK